MKVQIEENGQLAYLFKDNGRKNRYEIIKVSGIYKIYVSRKRNNSKWSEKFLLFTSKTPIKIEHNDSLPMQIEFKPINVIESIDLIE